MFELILVAMLLVSLAHKGKPRRRRALIVGSINFTLALSTLNDQTLISGTLGSNPGTETFLLSIKATWSLDNGVKGEGPIVVGVAHEDYTDAEIEAWIENTGSWAPFNLVQREIAQRKIRLVGSFTNDSGSATLSTESLNEGRPIKTICRWANSDTQSLKVWAFNKAGGNLTGAARVVVSGSAFLVKA